MSGHVVDRLGDLLAGRLDPEERIAVEEHMKTCGECASQVAWTRTLRERALRQGIRHLSTTRIVELADERSATSAAEREHLNACADCRAEIRWTKGVPALGDLAEDAEAEEDPHRRTAPRSSGWMPFWRWWPLGLAAAAMVVVVSVLLVPRPGPKDLSALAIVEAIPVSISRSVPQPGSFEEQQLLGLEAYRDGDYDAARLHLQEATKRRPTDATARLYLGSALMILGDSVEAVENLAAAKDQATTRGAKDEAEWQLANASLLAGRTEEAAKILGELAEREGHRQDEARSLLKSVRDAQG